jgi:hypothetical protein
VNYHSEGFLLSNRSISQAQRYGKLTNAIEGNFLLAEERAAITIDLIHVITFFTLTSAQWI